ncbi:collagen-like protein [Streptomyces aurantiacus]|uniref:Uncharacterized protein n=1 Tax=Streptomyces aurantiacus JA 4570 TaxID=1286094 RepID=S3ZAU3_9ACTN|nr:hypothetical protein [Streptomyces aurantiacus]EPH40836.1 hypothetical protein STRAU_6051 [Streptomyces aurantiacus JA 4570]
MKRRHAQPILAQRWRPLAVAAVLLVLSGAVILVWLRIDAEARRADALADEANLRGDAVAVLAGDVRVLREQIKAKGGTPAAPDPERAVEDLPDRAEVPVPTAGPDRARGAHGEKGDQGSPGKSGPTPKPGPSGVKGDQGEPGSSVTGPPGPAGPPGTDGKDGSDGRAGVDGKDGASGQTCPDGYTLQAPSWDPDALVCRRNGAPAPDPPSPSPAAFGLPMERRKD